MRALIALALVGILSGCAVGIAMNAPPPGIDEFPQQELLFQVAGDTDKVLRGIQEYLVNRELPSIATVRAPKTYVVTTYIEEPRKASDRRVRRTAFRLALSQVQSNTSLPCTSVAVVGLTKSRGIHEEIWSTQEADATYTSSAWPQIKKLLERRGCK